MRISDWSSDVCSSDLLLDQYLPSAQRRGMTLADVLVSPPLWCDQDPNTLTVTWTVDGTAGWWSMTRQGRRDSTLRQGWDAMAPLIIERSRYTGIASCRERVWQYV